VLRLSGFGFQGVIMRIYGMYMEDKLCKIDRGGLGVYGTTAGCSKVEALDVYNVDQCAR